MERGGLAAQRLNDFDREVVLEDGARLRIRPVSPGDEGRLAGLVERLSRRTAYQRFFTVMTRLPTDWARDFARVDHRRRVALVAESALARIPELVGVVRYEPTDEEDMAEVAIVIQDHWQGRGLGAILLNELLRAGEANGVRRFRAQALSSNRRALAMLFRLTDVREHMTEAGVATVVFVRRAQTLEETGASPAAYRPSGRMFMERTTSSS